MKGKKMQLSDVFAKQAKGKDTVELADVEKIIKVWDDYRICDNCIHCVFEQLNDADFEEPFCELNDIDDGYNIPINLEDTCRRWVNAKQPKKKK